MANTSWSWNASEIHSPHLHPCPVLFPLLPALFFPLPFSLPFLPCSFALFFCPSQPTRPAEANCPGDGGAGRFAQGTGCEGDSRMLTKFWAVSKSLRQTLCPQYGSCPRSLRRVPAVSGPPKRLPEAFRNSPKLNSIREPPHTPAPVQISPRPTARTIRLRRAPPPQENFQ